jgi:hypothetical protein
MLRPPVFSIYYECEDSVFALPLPTSILSFLSQVSRSHTVAMKSPLQVSLAVFGYSFPSSQRFHLTDA